MRRAAQFTTFVSRLKQSADVKNIEEAKKVIQEGRLILRLPQLLPRDQITVMESFDKLGMPKHLWNAIGDSFNESLDKKLPFDIAKIASILAKHVDEGKLDWSAIEGKLMNASNDNLSFDPYLVNIHTLLATHGKGSAEFWRSTESLCLTSIENALKTEFKLPTIQNLLSKLIWSYSTANQGSIEFWDGIDALAHKVIPGMTSKNYSKLILSISKVSELSDSLKIKLMKQASFHIGDATLGLLDLHDILLGLNMIDPSANTKAAKEIAEASLDRVQSLGFIINSTVINSLYRILFELTEINELNNESITRLQSVIASKLSQMRNQQDLHFLKFKARMYIATLPDLSTHVKAYLVDSISDECPRAEDIINMEPADFALLTKYKRVAASLDLSIESSLPSKINEKNVFWINRFSACLAKLELSKLHSSSPYFVEELGQSYSRIVKEFEALIKDQSIPPPRVSDKVTKHLFAYLGGQTSVQATLRRLARVYPSLSETDLSTASCLLMTMIYLRHEDDDSIRKSTEQFVMKNIQVLSGAPFLGFAVAGLSKSLTVTDKKTLIKALTSSIDKDDEVSVANSLILFFRLTQNEHISKSIFATSINQLQASVKQMTDAAQRYLVDKYWIAEHRPLFDVKAIDELAVNEQIDFDTNVLKKNENGVMESDSKQDDIEKQRLMGDFDLLSALLVKLYPDDPDLEGDSNIASSRSEDKKQPIKWNTMDSKGRVQRPKLVQTSTDLFLSDQSADIDDDHLFADRE